MNDIEIISEYDNNVNQKDLLENDNLEDLIKLKTDLFTDSEKGEFDLWCETLYKYTLSKECLTTKFRVNEFERRKPNLVKLENFYDSNNISKNRLYFEYIMMSYSCFSHLFRKENKNTRKENLGYIASIINSESVTNSLREFNSSSFGEVIAAKILKSKNKRLIYFVSYILYVITKRY